MNKDETHKTQSQVADSNQLNPAVHPGTDIQLLSNAEIPREMLSADFPSCDWPISGGWGYSQEDAVVVDTDSESAGVSLEYQFLECRSHEEATKYRSKGQRLEVIRLDLVKQSFRIIEGKSYDIVVMKVTATIKDDFDFLKQGQYSHHSNKDNREDILRRLLMAQTKQICYQISGWFDISKMYEQLFD